MEEYKHNSEQVVFYFINNEIYGHLVQGQNLATNKEFTIYESLEDFNSKLQSENIELYTYEEEVVFNKELYKERVVQLIRERYDINAELDVQRNRDTELTKFKEYFDYVEQCKIQARVEMGNQ